MNKRTLLIIAYVIVSILIVIITLQLIKRKKTKELARRLERLDKEKNELESAPVISELAKIEPIIKNERMEKIYKGWFDEFDRIREKDIPAIRMLLDDSYKKGDRVVVQVIKKDNYEKDNRN